MRPPVLALLALALLPGAARAQARPPLLSFPEPGLDDTAAYRGYRTRFWQDAAGNTLQVYLDGREGRVVHLWADAENESLGLSARDGADRPAALRWDGATARVTRAGRARTVEYRVAADLPELRLGWFLLGSMRVERDFQYWKKHRAPFTDPPFELEEQERLFAALDRLPDAVRRAHLAPLGAADVAALRARVRPALGAGPRGAAWVARVVQRTLDARDSLVLEVVVDPRRVDAARAGEALTLRARDGRTVPLTLRVTTTGAPLSPLTRAEIFTPAFTAFAAEAARAAARRGRCGARAERQMRGVELLASREKLMAGLPTYATYFGRDQLVTALMMRPIWREEVPAAVIASVLRKLSPDGTGEPRGGAGRAGGARGGRRVRGAGGQRAGRRRAARRAARPRGRGAARPPARARELPHDRRRAAAAGAGRALAGRRRRGGGAQARLPPGHERRRRVPAGAPAARAGAGGAHDRRLRGRPRGGEPDRVRGARLGALGRHQLARQRGGLRERTLRDGRQRDLGAARAPGDRRDPARRRGLGFAATRCGAYPPWRRHPAGDYLRDSRRCDGVDWWGASRHFLVALPADEVRARVEARLAATPEAERAHWRTVLARTSADRTPLEFLALALDERGRPVGVANSDPATRLFLGESLLRRGAADSAARAAVLRDVRLFARAYPAGLLVDGVGPVVANDAYAARPVWAAFEEDRYHGPRVVWGREVNLFLLGVAHHVRLAGGPSPRDPALAAYVRELVDAAARVERAVEASGFHSELWSYDFPGGRLTPVRYGSGADVQLWSTTDLAVRYALRGLAR
jgi:hypothetical protein